MPRASKEQSAAHHKSVMENSAKLFRERGMHGVSVAELMRSAGLTHGGFYGHFDSKEQLIAEACTHAFRQSVDRWQDRVAGEATASEAYQSLVGGFLSARNRDQAGSACPTPAFIADVAREPKGSAVRNSYREGVQQLLGILQSVQPSGGATARQHAVAQFAMMVGALALARATQGDPLSDEFLSSARQALLGASLDAAALEPSRSRP